MINQTAYELGTNRLTVRDTIIRSLPRFQQRTEE